MSWETEQWARKQRVGDPVRKAVLVAIANEADTSGRNAFPSIRFLAHQIEVSERTVQRRIRELELLELVETVPRYRPDGSFSSNEFILKGYSPPEEWHDRPRRRGRRDADERGDNLTPPPGDNLSPVGDGGDTPPGDTAVTPKTLPELPFPPAVGDKSPPAPPQGGAGSGAGDSKPKRKTGNRLPDDWRAPPIEDLPLALQAVIRQWPAGAYAFVEARFIAHWSATPGARASKLDWTRAWQNWIPNDSRLVMQLKREGCDFGAASSAIAAPADRPTTEAEARVAEFASSECALAAKLRAALRAAIGERTYDGWLRSTAIHWDELDGVITVFAASSFMRNWIEEHFRDVIGNIAAKLLERRLHVRIREVAD